MLSKIEKLVACVCVSIMAVLVFVNVIARYVFGNSLAVSDEMSTYLFVLMSFMGTAVAARRKAHLGLSIVTDHVRAVLPPYRHFRHPDGHQPVSDGSGDRHDAVA